MKTKVKAKRCPKCRKPKTLIDISGEMQNINPFTIKRSYSGILCTSCNWSEKTYAFVEEGKV
jgi:uncharacterized protein with PIN domain